MKKSELKYIIRDEIKRNVVSKTLMESINKKESFEVDSDVFNTIADLIVKNGGADLRDMVDIMDEAPKEKLMGKDYIDIDMVQKNIGKKSEKTIYEISIPADIIDRMEEIFRESKTHEIWYEKVRDVALKNLGESDGSLFLICFAITSPEADLSTNFKRAAIVMDAIKKDFSVPKHREALEDFAKNPDVVKKFKQDREDKKNLRYSQLSPINYMKLYTVRYATWITKSFPGLARNLGSVIHYYIKSNGNLNSKYLAKEIGSFMNEFHESPRKNRETVGAISSFKVLSFALNLLDPDYTYDSGWSPVTLDTHMQKFFFPHMKGKKKNLFDNKFNYAKVTSLVNEISNKMNIKPHQAQAILWITQMVENEKSKGYTKLVATLDDVVEGLTELTEDYKGIYEHFNKALNVALRLGKSDIKKTRRLNLKFTSEYLLRDLKESERKRLANIAYKQAVNAERLRVEKHNSEEIRKSIQNGGKPNKIKPKKIDKFTYEDVIQSNIQTIYDSVKNAIETDAIKTSKLDEKIFQFVTTARQRYKNEEERLKAETNKFIDGFKNARGVHQK